MADYENWMSDRWADLQDRSIFHVAMPGTHNSGVFSADNTIGVRTQDVEIDAQLSGGIRSFDIRVMKWGGVFFMHHSGIAARGQEFSKAARQFADFAKGHPREKVVIHLDAGYGSNLTEEDKAELRAKAVDEWGPSLAPPPTGGTYRLVDLVGSLIVVSLIGAFPSSWGSDTWRSSWNSYQSDCGPTIGAKIDWLKPHLSDTLKAWATQGMSEFGDAACAVWTINLWDAAHQVNPNISGWLSEWSGNSAILAGANLVTVDFFQVGFVVPAVIELNASMVVGPPARETARVSALPEGSSDVRAEGHAIPRFIDESSFTEDMARYHFPAAGLDW